MALDPAVLRSHRLTAAARLFRRSKGGASAVEFALVLPLLCFFLLGILQGGVFFGVVHALEQIAANSGRYALAGLDVEERQAMVANLLPAEAGRYPMIRSDRLTVATTESDGFLVVTLSYDASYLPQVAFLGSVIGLPATVQRSATLLLP